MCLDHLRSDCMVTLKYLQFSTISSNIVQIIARCYLMLCGSSDLQYVTFGYAEFEQPIKCFPIVLRISGLLVVVAHPFLI